MSWHSSFVFHIKKSRSVMGGSMRPASQAGRADVVERVWLYDGSSSSLSSVSKVTKVSPGLTVRRVDKNASMLKAFLGSASAVYE